MALTLAGCGKASTPIGSWHNEELSQLLRFHEDGTVVIRTTGGDTEATYIYDKDGKQGVITLNGQSIGFTLDGGSLTLKLGDIQTVFVPGDMEIAAASPEATPASTPTPEAATSAPAATPTATPAPTATPEASSAFGPSISLGHFPDFSFMPLATDTPTVSAGSASSLHVVIPGNILGNLANPLSGEWYYTEDNSYVLTFDGNGEFTFAQGSSGISGAYTYDSSTHSGVLTLNFYNISDVSFSVDGDTLTWETGETFVRN
jgi:hypothetical protein